MIEALDIQVKGIVQGVGFRYRARYAAQGLTDKIAAACDIAG